MPLNQPRGRPGAGERGAALIVSLVALVALLGIGGVTILAVQSEIRSAGHDRFTQMATYAAESGASVGLEYLRNVCSGDTLFSDSVEPNNANPQQPTAIIGNLARPGAAGNVFDDPSGTYQNHLWYEVTILNNIGDTGLATGDDLDSQVILRVVGHGPNETMVTLELEVYNASCLASFCEQEFAQENMTARNDAIAACSTQVDPASGARTFTPGVAP